MNGQKKPRIALLFCRNAIKRAAHLAEALDSVKDLDIDPVVLPCSSKVEIAHLERLLEQGADAVEVVACPPECCRFLAGGQKRTRRIDYIHHYLDSRHIKPERIGITHGAGFTAEQLIDLARKRAESWRG